LRRFLIRLFIVGLLAGLGLVGIGYRNAASDPVIRRASVAVADWPQGAPPIKVLLISDIHVAEPDMPPARLARIVSQLNALKPDLVLIAGDLISEKRLATHIYAPAEVVAPLAKLKATHGVIAVLGNHDHWVDAAVFTSALEAVGVTVLANAAVLRGGLVVGGVDDEYSRHADVPATYRAMDTLKGPRVIVTHDPDIVPDLPASVAAVFAGHTHCGQAILPWSGQPAVNVSRYGMRFQCGDITDEGQRVFVSAGLGTSGIWLRYGAPPDAWLVTLGPANAAPVPAPAR
jgi:uncharacterized protein